MGSVPAALSTPIIGFTQDQIRSVLGETKLIRIPSLHEVRPTSDQQLAMRAMLTNFLGESDFDRLCVGIKVGVINEDVLMIVVPAGNCATDIKLYHSDDFAVAAEYALGLPIRMVNIVVSDLQPQATVIGLPSLRRPYRVARRRGVPLLKNSSAPGHAGDGNWHLPTFLLKTWTK